MSTTYDRNGRRPHDYPACSVCKVKQADGYGSPGLHIQDEHYHVFLPEGVSGNGPHTSLAEAEYERDQWIQWYRDNGPCAHANNVCVVSCDAPFCLGEFPE
jgi:hypothetical protein